MIHFSILWPLVLSSQTTHWLEIVQALLLSEISDLRHRGVVIVHNMMQAEKSLAETLMESEALEILSVMAKGGEGMPEPVRKIAQNCLDKAVEYNIIMTREGKEKGKEFEPWKYCCNVRMCLWGKVGVVWVLFGTMKIFICMENTFGQEEYKLKQLFFTTNWESNKKRGKLSSEKYLILPEWHKWAFIA